VPKSLKTHQPALPQNSVPTELWQARLEKTQENILLLDNKIDGTPQEFIIAMQYIAKLGKSVQKYLGIN